MPRDLPILILSGDEDPVGGNGKGVRRFEKMLKRAGMKNVTCMLYPHARHELLNDLDKEQVLHDIEHWCDTIERRNRGKHEKMVWNAADVHASDSRMYAGVRS